MMKTNKCKTYMRWTDEMKFVLAKKACIHNAYIRSEGKDALTAEEKWRRVQSDICNDEI
jgi:PIN domain nuclease of toxin-antitoxin system